MSESSLPDDLARWPDDPYAILGVSPSVTPKDLKRTYTKLIRVYKPELRPEEFRRIREAYEQVLRHVEWISQLGIRIETDGDEQEPASSPDQAAQPSPEGVEPSASDGEPRHVRPAPQPTNSKEERLRAIWDLACSGAEEQAYQRLVEMHLAHGATPDVALRCYWLLSLTPELDSTRQPCDWLEQGLATGGWYGPLGMLYHQELATSDEEVISERPARIFRLPGPVWLISTLVNTRWRAAFRLRRPLEIIAADLPVLEKSVLAGDEAAWLQLCSLGIEVLAWENTPAAAAICGKLRKWIEDANHLHSQCSHVLDRLDLLAATIPAWHKLNPDAGDLKELVAQGWVLPGDELRGPLLKFAAKVVSRPTESLDYFTRLGESNPQILFRLASLVMEVRPYIPPPPESRSDEFVERLVEDFVLSTPWYHFTKWRPRLVEFCLQEAISIDQFVEAIGEAPRFQLTATLHLREAILKDWAVRCVCDLVRMFHAA